jgi:sugar O-acyltransferase (sialic acid O-acetyltransferase NeuD family)
MKKICIFGSGGFAKEVFWLSQQCKREVVAFIDVDVGHNKIYDTDVKSEDFFNPNEHSAVVAIGSSQLRKKIVNKIINRYGDDVFATLISPSANLMADDIKIGKGSVICANCILTCNIDLGNWAQLNLATTIGHDTTTGDFFTTAPGVHISGKVSAGECVYFGTNASSIENISICNDVLIGASACVSKNINESGTYVGVPAKKIIRN